MESRQLTFCIDKIHTSESPIMARKSACLALVSAQAGQLHLEKRKEKEIIQEAVQNIGKIN
jgi:hypothetical protein